MNESASIVRHRLDEDAQRAILNEVARIVRQAPFFRPVLPRWGTPFSVLMTNCGSLGWVSDKTGYRYQPDHPETGTPWPPMPRLLLDLWKNITRYRLPPEACLINYYAQDAKMGLHQDRDELDFDAPVLSISLGDDARFRLGGVTRNAPTQTTILRSGDVMTLERETRLAFHGIDRVYPGTSTLLSASAVPGIQNGRLNLTLRRVNRG
jgi:alkylated DNA repair protein (DNA oxidative demethylase)